MLPWLLGTGLLVVAVPLFLRLPLTNDAEVFDLHTALALRGGVLYRELLEPNLPGVFAVHAGVRLNFGDSPEALRVWDLIWLGVGLAAAARLLALMGASGTHVGWTTLLLAAGYLSQSEWCHCQRDSWMVPWAMLALGVRLRRCLDEQAPIDEPQRSKGAWWLSCCEGMLWGTAVWLKPYVLLAAAGVWFAAGAWMPFRRWCRDAVWCAVGGGLMGAVGIGVMLATGCWDDFLLTMRDWNPGYFAAGQAHRTWGRAIATAYRLSPWDLLPLIAVAGGLIGGIRNRTSSANRPVVIGRGLILGGLLGWAFQALVLQHPFDYVFAPLIWWGGLWLAAGSIDAITTRGRIAWGLFAAVVLMSSPFTEPTRLRHWPACVTGEVSPARRQDLMQLRNPSQVDLAAVADYLRGQGVRDREVVVYNSDLIALYRRLGLVPPIRYGYLFETLQFFPERRAQILAEVTAAAPRFLVTDLQSCGLPARLALEVGPAGPNGVPPVYADLPTDVLPWSWPVVYRAGSYLVHVRPAGADDPPVGD
jgi:hypothetical protein